MTFSIDLPPKLHKICAYGQMNMTSSMCVQFMYFVNTMHNKKSQDN